MGDPRRGDGQIDYGYSVTANSELTVVVRQHVYLIQFELTGDGRAAELVVSLDEQSVWIFQTAGWISPRLGLSERALYVWTARELIVFPSEFQGVPVVITLDEDLRFVFGLDDGWLVVCETSVRRLVQEVQTAAVYLGEVLVAAHLVGGELVVRDFSGRTWLAKVDGERLNVSPR